MPNPWLHPVPPVAVWFRADSTVARVHGSLVEVPVGLIEGEVGPLSRGIAAANRPVVVNVSRVARMDPDGLRWLMRLTRVARSGGLTLILESPTRAVDAVLALTGCHDWFDAITRPGAPGRHDTARLIQSLPA